MADLSANIVSDEHASPSQDELQQMGNGANVDRKRSRMSAAGDDDDDDDDKPGRERRKIEIKFIQDKSRRHITFSKRKAGIMKKVCPVAFRRASNRRFELPLLFLAIFEPVGCSMTNVYLIGLRIVRIDWYSSTAARCLRDWSRLHIHHSQTTTSGHQTRGQEPYSGKLRKQIYQSGRHPDRLRLA